MTAILPRVAALIPSLGRANDYEVVATARAIERVLRGAGLDWHDLATAVRLEAPCGHAVSAPQQPSFVDLARACRDLDRGRLTPRERTFVIEVSCRRVWQPSPKQAAWLSAIYDRLQGRAAA